MSKIIMLVSSLALAFTAACGDDGGTPATKDAAPHVDAGVDAPASTTDANCISNPDMTNYKQIINACTSATKIYKDSHPPHLLSDGGLPPIGTTL
jgi:hypothetical protein